MPRPSARDLPFKPFDIRCKEDIAVETGERVVHVSALRIVGRYMHVREVTNDQIMLTLHMDYFLQAH